MDKHSTSFYPNIDISGHDTVVKMEAQKKSANVNSLGSIKFHMSMNQYKCAKLSLKLSLEFIMK